MTIGVSLSPVTARSQWTDHGLRCVRFTASWKLFLEWISEPPDVGCYKGWDGAGRVLGIFEERT
jgi:hypothetical protein